MQTTKQPYEFLARWDKSGKLAGAHIQWRYVVTGDDGSVVTESATAAEPIGADTAFPLSDLLQQVTTDALASLASVTAERDALQAEHEAAIAALVAERDALAAQIAANSITNT
ncbi:MAG TPA: hypothetical protein VFF65_12650 [Phycisphaerales bacterium]|nr:hypothetical protein [Phycisphaerales bacterium]